MSNLKLVNEEAKKRQQEAEQEVKKPQRLGAAEFDTPASENPELAPSNDEKAFQEYLNKRAQDKEEADVANEEELKREFLKEREEQRAANSVDERTNFLKALEKAYNGDLDQDVVKNTKLVDYLSNNYDPEKNWDKQPDGAPIVFKNKHTQNQISVSKDEIVYGGNAKDIPFEDALSMVQFAMLDKDFQEQGFTLQGATPAQQAVFEQAVAFVNEGLPEGQKIKMHNKPVEPAKWNLASDTFGNVAKAVKKAKAFINSPNTPNGFAAAKDDVLSTEEADAAISDAVKDLSDETPANGLTEEVQASLKEQLAADFGDSADKGVKERTVSRDKIAGYLTEAGIKTGKGSKKVDVAAAFLEKENLVEARTNGKRTTYLAKPQENNI